MKDYIFIPYRITHIAAGESQKADTPKDDLPKLQLTIQLLIRNTGLLRVLPANTIQENQKVGSIYGEQSKEGYNKEFYFASFLHLASKFGLIVVSRSLAQVPNDSADLGKNKHHVKLISFSVENFMEMELWVCFIIFLSSQGGHLLPPTGIISVAYSLTFLRALLPQVKDYFYCTSLTRQSTGEQNTLGKERTPFLRQTVIHCQLPVNNELKYSVTMWWCCLVAKSCPNLRSNGP